MGGMFAVVGEYSGPVGTLDSIVRKLHPNLLVLNDNGMSAYFACEKLIEGDVMLAVYVRPGHTAVDKQPCHIVLIKASSPNSYCKQAVDALVDMAGISVPPEPKLSRVEREALEILSAHS